MNEINPTIKAIEAERLRQNMSVPELADRAKVHFSGLYRVLSGDAVPSLETVDSLLAALKMKLIVKR